MQITTEITKAIRTILADSISDWASLTDVRRVLEADGWMRSEFDAAITQMAIAQQIRAIPEENQKTLDDMDRYNAVVIGGEPKHLVGIA